MSAGESGIRPHGPTQHGAMFIHAAQDESRLLPRGEGSIQRASRRSLDDHRTEGLSAIVCWGAIVKQREADYGDQEG